jgi:hypothetical protein
LGGPYSAFRHRAYAKVQMSGALGGLVNLAERMLL